MKTSFPNDSHYCIMTVKSYYSDGLLDILAFLVPRNKLWGYSRLSLRDAKHVRNGWDYCNT